MDEESKKIISDHLNGLAAKDALFAETLKKPNKNIKDCCTYIMNTVKKSKRTCVPDAEVFGMAVHYYDEDVIDIGAPVAGRVTTGDKAPIPSTKTTVKKPVVKKEVKQQPSLF